MKNNGWIVVGGILFVIVCLVLGLISTVGSTQRELLGKQQAVQRGESQYGGALDIVSQKITGAFALADRQIAHEDRVYQALAEANAAFGKALESGTPPEQIQSALTFNGAFLSLTQSNPEFASAPVVQDAMNAMEEAVNEVFTAFQDWQDAVKDYNTYRGSLYAPAIIGSLLGFPSSFEYYEGVNTQLDLQGLIPPAPAP